MKRSYQTVEFWMNFAATFLVVLLASGVITTESQVATIVSMVLTALAALGYTGFRTIQKKTDAAMVVAKAVAEAKVDQQNPT